MLTTCCRIWSGFGRRRANIAQQKRSRDNCSSCFGVFSGRRSKLSTCGPLQAESDPVLASIAPICLPSLPQTCPHEVNIYRARPRIRTEVGPATNLAEFDPKLVRIAPRVSATDRPTSPSSPSQSESMLADFGRSRPGCRFDAHRTHVGPEPTPDSAEVRHNLARVGQSPARRWFDSGRFRPTSHKVGRIRAL